ncbi:ABC transporter permease [Tenacibaculum halocynthiae]|uniref:ABC transporter permease n=1 Tax=Tenacibaculum halocynthiae TaxID=1254437 RepID=UPI003D657BF4
MLKLNFLLVLRQIKKDKKSFFINLIGSAVGLTAIILMSLYIHYEDSYDKFNENVDRLYRIERTVQDKVQNQTFDSTPYELAEEVKSSFPEVINSASTASINSFLSIDDRLYPREEGIMANNNFLKMFSFKFVAGDSFNALKKPMSIVLSETLASKFFPSENAMGKVIKVNKKHNLTVTGIFKDYPKDSHISMKYMVSYNSYEELYGAKPEKNWNSNRSCTYVLLSKNTQLDLFSRKVKGLLSNHVDYVDGNKEFLSLRPISDVYMKTLDVRNEAMAGLRNSILVIYLFILVAFFTAFVTTVNYINLTTTQLANRELEIGIKKVLGITKGQLRYQFVIESLVMIIGAILLSIVLVIIILPAFSSLVGRDLSLVFNGSGAFFLKIFIASILLGILGGLYPVVYLASLKISSFLQGNTSIKRRKYLRKGLVVFQLFITIPLIFLSYNTISQINYLNEKDLGFKKDNLLMSWVKTPTNKDVERLKVIKNKLLQNPNILSYSISEGAPFLGAGEEKSLGWENSSNNDKIRISSYGVDYDFINTFKMNLVKGRWFSKDHPTDLENSCIINEVTAQRLGWKDPIGKTFDNRRLKVIGVVKDFHQNSLFQEISPLMFTMNLKNEAYMAVSIKVNSNNKTETKNAINKVFNSHFIDTPIEFGFLEDGFDEGYMSALENVMKIFVLFSIISIIMVIIGLYSLISFSLKMQKKTIAIRKVLGASTKGLFVFILKEYIILYIIAALSSLVLTYMLIMELAKSSANSVGVGILDFAMVISITLFIVLVTISGKIWTASKESPIDAISIE